MSSVIISGDVSGTVTLQAPSAAGSTVITLPATSGTLLQSGTTVTEAQGGTGTTTGYYGFKNRIINGAMMIDQRNAGASVSITTATYTLDRFSCGIGYSTGHTAQQSTNAPPNYKNSLLITVGTGASPTAGQIGRIVQAIEGFNVSDFGWGTATASAITLSFWVKSSLTGTFAGGIYNNAANRTYVFTYVINAANTWEQKTITIAGDTSGTWTTDNTAGMWVNWDLGTGSTFQGTANTWAAGAAWATSTSVKLAATSGATLQITGVQLEKGSTATSFDYRPYGTELALCQRYFETGGNYLIWSGMTTSTAPYYYVVRYAVVKRATPNSITFTDVANQNFPSGVPTLGTSASDGFYCQKSANATAASGYFNFTFKSDAEL